MIVNVTHREVLAVTLEHAGGDCLLLGGLQLSMPRVSAGSLRGAALHPLLSHKHGHVAQVWMVVQQGWDLCG